MSKVYVRVFDTAQQAATYASQMETDGYRVALSESAEEIRILFEVDGQAKGFKIEGDGSNFVVMAFDGG